ncbi:hypothetical protein BGZ80_002750, partial [Entomortierella chlamydospora]
MLLATAAGVLVDRGLAVSLSVGKLKLLISNKRTRVIDMLRNFFSSPTSDLSPEESLELVNKRLELAHEEDDTAKKLELVNSANSRLKDTENIFVSKKVKDPSLCKGIANAYHEHGELLDGLGHHDKAKKSHNRADKWG